MRTEHLEYLVDLHQTLSLSKTAENFYTTHQSINSAIKSLEKELDVDILNRTHRGILFTEPGILVYQHALKILQEQNQLAEHLTPFKHTKRSALQGELNIYTIPRFSNRPFLKIYSSFCKHNPLLSVNLKSLTPSLFYQLLPTTSPFIFISTAQKNTLSSKAFLEQLEEYNLQYDIIQEYTLGVAYKSHSQWEPQLKDAPASKILQQVPIALFNYALDENYLLLDESTMSNMFFVDGFDAQKQLIKADTHVAYCTPNEYQLFFYDKQTSIEFKLLNDPPQFSYIIIYPQELKNDPRIESFLTLFKKNYC
ncbi:MAG: LysR family transcriptional regulator [Peptococcaceae bacterium]|nr:LysR family transcriptional regulator [Peptococcaceae bacterium]